MEELIYKKSCPNCGNEQIYKNKISLKRSIDNNIKCASCAQTGCRVGINNYMFGRHHTKEVIDKIKEKRSKQIITDEHRKIMSEAQIGRKHSDESIQKMSSRQMGINNSFFGKKHTKESIKKNSISNTGRTHSPETKLKMRISMIKYTETVLLKGGQMTPNYNISSIPIIEQKAKELGIDDLQHAENGGEYHIKELGYWVDGYSKDKNIVIEYYEKNHRKKIKKDVQRQTEITDLLGCKFIIIYET